MTDGQKVLQDVSRNLSFNLFVIMGEKRRMKIIDLSRKSGVSTTTISKIRNDFEGTKKLKLETIANLAAALEVDVTDLLKEVKI